MVLFIPPISLMLLDEICVQVHSVAGALPSAQRPRGGALPAQTRLPGEAPPASAMTGNYGTPPRTRPASSPPTPAEQPGLLTRQERHLLGKPRHHSAHPRGRAAVAQPHARVDCDRVELLFERLAEGSRCPRRGRVRHLHEERGSVGGGEGSGGGSRGAEGRRGEERGAR